MALVSDPSLEGYNSFVSVEEADEYFSGTFFGSGKKWTDFEDEEVKSALLITATRRLNSLPWGGRPLSDTQSLSFPRAYGAYTPTIGIIPQWLKSATCEMARWLWEEEDRPATESEFAMLKSMKVGPLDFQFRDNMGALPPVVASILKGAGPHVIDLSTGPRTKQMVL